MKHTLLVYEEMHSVWTITVLSHIFSNFLKFFFSGMGTCIRNNEVHFQSNLLCFGPVTDTHKQKLLITFAFCFLAACWCRMMFCWLLFPFLVTFQHQFCGFEFIIVGTLIGTVSRTGKFRRTVWFWLLLRAWVAASFFVCAFLLFVLLKLLFLRSGFVRRKTRHSKFLVAFAHNFQILFQIFISLVELHLTILQFFVFFNQCFASFFTSKIFCLQFP